MSHPYKSQVKTGQQRASSRYTPVPSKTPVSPLLADAKGVRESDGPEEIFTDTPPRQISNTGKVRK